MCQDPLGYAYPYYGNQYTVQWQPCNSGSAYKPYPFNISESLSFIHPVAPSVLSLRSVAFLLNLYSHPVQSLSPWTVGLSVALDAFAFPWIYRHSLSCCTGHLRCHFRSYFASVLSVILHYK